ncbi:SDR family oxidoreductase [Aquibium carbonis]|uniref:SDR family oxidoreductase n=1 Tax=Aquibium carbonis TaxID=2495581 RepID=A0A429Z1P9_9HYPH|nr:SDR family oxidoreductase [Aquibium carbonis]RST87633.1 SDR family oxidoreductase [Aquibium carbonis]
MRIFIFGAGYSGRAFARRMEGKAEWIAGTTRSAGKFDALSRDGMRPVLFDGADLSPEARALLAETTHLVISAGPQNGDDPVLAVARETILSAMPALEWIGYLSTVGVYGDHDGAWVNEDSECRPSAQRSTERLKAEAGWLEIGRARGVPVAVLRLSGIYGPGRNALVNLASGTAKRVIREGQVFNRIHVADIAAALEHLGGLSLGGVYNVSDDRPCPPQDVISFAAGLMGVEPPPEVAFEDAVMSPMALSFWGENKRVSNAKIRQTGFDFGYPDHETALTRMWREDDWHGEADEVRTTRRKMV